MGVNKAGVYLLRHGKLKHSITRDTTAKETLVGEHFKTINRLLAKGF